MTKDIPAIPMRPSQIREERLRLHWSQYDLAECLGATRITVTRWENGISYPNVYFRRKLCELFSKSETELGLFPENMNGRKQVVTQEQIQKSFSLYEDVIGSQPALIPTEVFLPL
jgi:transcriptional regulator with XRE-family HTH domain